MAIGKVIKGDQIPEPAPAPKAPARPAVMNAEVFDARQAAQAILEEAHRERERILAETRRQAEQILVAVREQARQEGLAQVTEVLARAKVQAGTMLADAENEIISLACKVAEKILGRDVERSPELVVDICANAIEQVRTARAMVVRVHPQSAATLRAKKPQLLEMIGRSVDPSIKEDPEVAPMGCIIQTEFGTIDAQLATQFEVLRALFQPSTSSEGPA